MILALAGCVSEKNQTAGGKATPAVASGEALSRQAMGRKLLDACVYGQARDKDVDRQSMIQKCHCASDTALKTIGEGDMSVARSGGFTPVQNEALRGGIAACFKPAA